MQNLDIGDFDVALVPRTSEHVLRTTSIGTSRLDGRRRVLPMENVRIHDIRFLPGGDRGVFRFGINAQGTQGHHVAFSRIDLTGIAERSWVRDDGRHISSFTAYARDSRGVTFEEITGSGLYGVAIIDSTEISVRRSQFRHAGREGEIRSYGLFLASGDAPYFPIGDISVDDTGFAGYDVGVRYPSDACGDWRLTQVAADEVGEARELGGSCLFP